MNSQINYSTKLIRPRIDADLSKGKKKKIKRVGRLRAQGLRRDLKGGEEEEGREGKRERERKLTFEFT